METVKRKGDGEEESEDKDFEGREEEKWERLKRGEKDRNGE